MKKLWKKLDYVFTNGIYAKLVVLFNKSTDDIDTESLNERVLNEVLLPNEWNTFYYTREGLEKMNWEKDDEGYYSYVINVYSSDNKEYFYNEENLIIKHTTQKEIIAWNDAIWTTIVELD